MSKTRINSIYKKLDPSGKLLLNEFLEDYFQIILQEIDQKFSEGIPKNELISGSEIRSIIMKYQNQSRDYQKRELFYDFFLNAVGSLFVCLSILLQFFHPRIDHKLLLDLITFGLPTFGISMIIFSIATRNSRMIRVFRKSRDESYTNELNYKFIELWKMFENVITKTLKDNVVEDYASSPLSLKLDAILNFGIISEQEFHAIQKVLSLRNSIVHTRYFIHLNEYQESQEILMRIIVKIEKASLRNEGLDH
ncbi:MAG: hypothetical protein AB9891_14760 [Anaerolineaceae bacterium]